MTKGATATAPADGLVFASIAERTGALVVLDEARRTYAGLSRDGSYWHLIQPGLVNAVHPETGEIVKLAGELVCTCKGRTFHGSCYRLSEALALEERQADEAAMPKWAPAPMKAAARG